MHNTFPIRSIQLDPDEVQTLYSELVNEKYFAVALLTALIYHSTLTMKEEVRYFWVRHATSNFRRGLIPAPKPKPFNPISLIYFANRYIGILSAASSVVGNGLSQNLASCEFFIWSIGLCNLITILLTDYILVIRVQAFYGKDKKMTVMLYCSLALEAGVGFAILIRTRIWEKLTVFVEPRLFSACGALGNPPKILGIISWIVPLAFGFLLLILSLYKAAEYWRLSSGFKGLHLIKVLVRDQVLYYGLAIFCWVFKITANSTDVK